MLLVLTPGVTTTWPAIRFQSAPEKPRKSVTGSGKAAALPLPFGATRFAGIFSRDTPLTRQSAISVLLCLGSDRLSRTGTPFGRLSAMTADFSAGVRLAAATGAARNRTASIAARQREKYRIVMTGSRLRRSEICGRQPTGG